MKPWLLMSAIALPFLATAAAPSLADDRSEACSSASLKGRYGLAGHGVAVGVYDKATPPNIHFYEDPLRVDIVSDETFDGRSLATFQYLGFANGSKFSRPPEPIEDFATGGVGDYSVSADCTGAEDVLYPPGNPAFPNNRFEIRRVLVLSNNGKTLHMLWTGVHFPSLPAALVPPGVTCAPPTGGCDLAVQIHSDGERY